MKSAHRNVQESRANALRVDLASARHNLDRMTVRRLSDSALQQVGDCWQQSTQRSHAYLRRAATAKHKKNNPYVTRSAQKKKSETTRSLIESAANIHTHTHTPQRKIQRTQRKHREIRANTHKLARVHTGTNIAQRTTTNNNEQQSFATASTHWLRPPMPLS